MPAARVPGPQGGRRLPDRRAVRRADEWVALRDRRPGRHELADIIEKLADMDRRSRRGPWTREHLELIEARPAELAETIAASIGREKKPFKADYAG